MIEHIGSVNAQYSGFFQQPVRQSLEQGRVARETEEAIFKRKQEEERKKIQLTYNSKGKIIEYEHSGRRLDVMV